MGVSPRSVCATPCATHADPLPPQNFNTDDGPGRDPSRVGEAYDASTSSELFTTISNAPIGGGSARQHMQELRAAQLRAAHQPPSAPVHVSRTIVQRCDQFHLGREAAVIAQELYKTVHARGIFGRGGRPTLDARIAACIFVGCRQSGSPRTLRELERLLGVDKREVGACFQTIQRHITTKQTKQTKPEELVGRFCNFLGLKVTQGVEHLALKIIENVDGRESSQPATIAAAAIYLACTELDVNKTSKEVSEVSEIGESTIRKMYKILRSEWDIREQVKGAKNVKADDSVSP